MLPSSTASVPFSSSGHSNDTLPQAAQNQSDTPEVKQSIGGAVQQGINAALTVIEDLPLDRMGVLSAILLGNAVPLGAKNRLLCAVVWYGYYVKCLKPY